MAVPDAHLQGQRLRLRALDVEDADAVFAYASDPQVACAAGWTPHESPFDTLAFIERCRSDAWGPVVFAVELIAARRVIGTVDIRIVSRMRRIGEFGYALARDHWGHGLNLEAGDLLLHYGFEVMGLRRIRATCAVANRRSVRTLEKLGLRQHKRYVATGGPADVALRVAYEISRSEWSRSRSEAGRAAARVVFP